MTSLQSEPIRPKKTMKEIKHQRQLFKRLVARLHDVEGVPMKAVADRLKKALGGLYADLKHGRMLVEEKWVPALELDLSAEDEGILQAYVTQRIQAHEGRAERERLRKGRALEVVRLKRDEGLDFEALAARLKISGTMPDRLNKVGRLYMEGLNLIEQGTTHV